MHLKFSKYSGLGNDFIFIDNVNGSISEKLLNISSLCHRNLGIGADGVVFVESSTKADYKMRIFNSDGNEAQMCGNALRCLYLFLEKRDSSNKNDYQIEICNRILKIRRNHDLIECEMGEVLSLEQNIQIQLSNATVTGHFVNTGVEHFVVVGQEIKSLDVDTLGREISHHTFFQPQRTNVNFIEKVNANTLKIRTFERGVEAETLACGTGAAAGAIYGAIILLMKPTIEVQTCLGKLFFDFQVRNKQIFNLTMSGPAEHIFEGSITLSSITLPSLAK